MESPNRISLDKLAYLAYKGQLFQVADQASGTALVGTNHVLFNPGTKGTPIRVISVRFLTDTGAPLSFGWIYGDPAVGGGALSSNLFLGGAQPQAINEANPIAVIYPTGYLVRAFTNPNEFYELLLPGAVLVPPGYGLIVTVPVGVATNTVSWLWA